MKFLKKLISYLSFGLKSANDEMLSQKVNLNSDNDGIVQVQESRNVYKDIKQGEVTQEVEELRHSTYRVDRESKKYKYLGEGTAEKIETDSNVKEGEYHFTLQNKINCDGVLDSFNKLDNNTYDVKSYTLDIKYHDIPRFRLERFCKMITVDIEKGIAKIKLHFSSFYDSYDSTSKSFLNSIGNLENISSYYEIKNNEFCSNILNISFTTYKSNGEDDLISYHFNNLEYLGYEKNYFEHVITYKASTYSRVDLLDKYYSKTMDNKYKNNERKNSTYVIQVEERVGNCDVCGNEMSIYDYDITKETFGYSICSKCLEKNLKN
ncbi:MAG: hypothetical protein IKT40_02640 [Bacilli bacterium]|nr:hypothetical protein [Bacilli bacterium]